MEFEKRVEFTFTIPSKYNRVIDDLKKGKSFAYVRSDGRSYTVSGSDLDDLVIDLGSEVKKRDPDGKVRKKVASSGFSFWDMDGSLMGLIGSLDGSVIEGLAGAGGAITEHLPEIASLVGSMPELFMGVLDVLSHAPEAIEVVLKIIVMLLEVLSHLDI